MNSVTAHGSTVEVTTTGVTVRRGAMAQNLLPEVLEVSADQLRGWYHQSPTPTSPGWIQFSLTDAPEGSVERPVRGFPATRGAANIVVFAPGQAEEYSAVHQSLTNLQAGYPLDEVTVAPTSAPTAEAKKDTKADAEKSSASDNGQDALFAVEEKPAPRRGNWKAVATPDTIPEPNTEADANNPVFGQNVTVTGDFAPYEKGEVWDMIAEAGGTVGKNVTKKTTLLVIGEWNSVTSKEKRARELREKGQEITLWTFDEFLKALGKTRRPDLEEVKGTSAPF
ncbi:MAG TPA: BRCT domain-containing protein [Candidatus Corynebacterium avicola]|uniref:BRCT domain-containing protein n=1 Tax=Candidatus Corynebacterium avicola TaxID=2838527 RepID=A0A9D1ULF8_9CORY|nr:BRCT domain-containing protein [Candidatus Corynebacterium avicola]